jgi:hypothetical protein
MLSKIKKIHSLDFLSVNTSTLCASTLVLSAARRGVCRGMYLQIEGLFYKKKHPVFVSDSVMLLNTEQF